MSIIKILFLTRYGRLGASSRLRSLQYLPWFKKMGFECSYAPLIDDALLMSRYKKGKYSVFDILRVYARRFLRMKHVRRDNIDLVVIEKEALPWLPASFERWLLDGVPYILDYDDAVFHKYDKHSSKLVRIFFGKRIDHLMASANLVVAGNQYLAQRALDAGSSRVEVIPTVIDLERYEIKPVPPAIKELLRIVWIGSPSTVHYLDLLREPLAILSQKFTFKLRIIGGQVIDFPDVNVEFMKWDEATEVELIKECDIGVMPLLDAPWEYGKCGYKLIQYMACSLPVVASPVGTNREIVVTGKNGFLADGVQEWLQALTLLMSDATLRQQMGQAGRQRVEDEYNIQLAAPRMAALLQAAMRQR